MGYGLSVNRYNVVAPTHVQLGGSSTWSADHTGFVDLVTGEDSSPLYTFRVPKTAFEGGAARVEVAVYKAAAGTEAISMEGGYFVSEVGSAVDVAATSMTSLSALTVVTPLSATDTTLGLYTLAIPEGVLGPDKIVTVKVQRQAAGTETPDEYTGDVVLADCALRIITDDEGEVI